MSLLPNVKDFENHLTIAKQKTGGFLVTITCKDDSLKETAKKLGEFYSNGKKVISDDNSVSFLLTGANISFFRVALHDCGMQNHIEQMNQDISSPRR